MPDIQTIHPATAVEIAHYPLMDQPTIATLIEAVHVAQQRWAKQSLADRRACLMNLATVLIKKRDEAARLVTNEMGKPLTQASAEIEKCALLCEYYAKEGEAFLEPEWIQTEFQKSYRCFQPLGIIFAIMPWNYPFWQVMRFAVPNLLVGNAGLLKHAPNVTGSALWIEHCFLEAGFPEHLFRSLVMDVSLAPFVIHHPHVAGVTFTGSVETGKRVAMEAGAALKKVVLELGGSDPYVILEDADLELAVEQCVRSRLNNAGQVCIAAKRMIVVEKVRKAFESKVLEKVATYKMGDPFDVHTTLGPMAREDLRTKLHEQVQRAIQSGARCVLGGHLPEGPGYFYPATVLLEVDAASPAFQEELFGPVICITSARDEADAIRLANQTEFGLSGAIFTQDINKGERLAKEAIEVGTCAVNALVSSDPRLPFGGIKHSGLGRELSREGLREFVNIKTVIVTNK